MNATFRKVLGGGVKVLRRTLWKEAARAKEPANPRLFLQNQNVSQQLSISPASHYWKSFLGKPPSLAKVNCVWETLSIRLRKEAVHRLLSPLHRGVRLSHVPRNGLSSYVSYFAFGFVGFVLTENKETSHPTQRSKDAGSFKEFCSSVRKHKEEQKIKHDVENDITYPNHLQGYEIEDKLIAKGSYGAIYPARISQCRTVEDVSVRALDDEVVSSTNKEQRDISDEEDISSSNSSKSCDSREWEFISQEEEVETDLASPPMEWTVLDYSSESGSLSDKSRPLSQADPSVSKSPLQKESKGMTNFSGRKQTTEQPHFLGEFNLAIKIIFNNRIRSDSSAIEAAFEKEKILLSDKLHPRGRIKGISPHPNIVKLYQAFVDDNISHRLKEAKKMFPNALPWVQFEEGCGRNMLMYLVMHRYEMTLHEYMKTRGCNDEGKAMMMLCQLLEGAAYLNSLSIAHRDLKSNNILVEVDYCGDPKLIKAAIYNLDYSKSDGWALGAIGYEICGMKNPFYQRGVDSATYDEKSLPGFPNFVSPAFEFVILGLLKKDPKERLTCAEAADMLHLQMWKQDYWMKGPMSLRKLSYLEQTLHSWLHQVTCPVDRTATEKISPVRAELQVTFLSRVNSEKLLQAARKLILFSWQRWLQEEVNLWASV